MAVRKIYHLGKFINQIFYFDMTTEAKEAIISVYWSYYVNFVKKIGINSNFLNISEFSISFFKMTVFWAFIYQNHMVSNSAKLRGICRNCIS